jgi:hypothetical protein
MDFEISETLINYEDLTKLDLTKEINNKKGRAKLRPRFFRNYLVNPSSLR